MHSCPNCGCNKEPLQKKNSTRHITFFNCSECDYSTWDNGDYVNFPILMFAYGMNLNPVTMRYWDGFSAVGAAKLDNHRLAFRNYADVVTCNDSSVYGGLWLVDRDGLKGMDGREGYPFFYDRKIVTVTMLEDGKENEALVYFMKEENRWDEHPARYCSWSYLNHIYLGFKAFGIPEEHLPFDKELLEDAFDF